MVQLLGDYILSHTSTMVYSQVRSVQMHEL